MKKISDNSGVVNIQSCFENILSADTAEKISAKQYEIPRREMLQWLGAAVGGAGLLHAAPALAAAAQAPATTPQAPTVAPQTPSAVAGASGTAPYWTPAKMDVLSAIHSRRSQRDFTGEPVPRSDIQAIIAAGMSAPSSKNSQPWEFIVMMEQASLQRIGQIQPLVGYASKAGAAIMLCTRLSKDIELPLSVISCACCGQNMLLAAHSLGYGGVWIQVYPKEEHMAQWQTALNLPETVMPLMIMPIGKVLSSLPPVNRMDARRIHDEKW